MNKDTFKSEYGQLSDRDFRRLSAFIYETFGIYLPEKKHYLLQNRLLPRLRKLGFISYSAYADYVLQQGEHGEETFEMISVVSTNKTEFFREKAHFDTMQQELLPCFYEQKINIWSAGCSSGEEVYSLTMLLGDEKSAENISDFIVYGNDISGRILEKAVKAVYPYRKIESIPEKYRRKYLMRSKNRTNATIRIVPELRGKTKFVRENLVGNRDTMPLDFQFVFCRNTLIYFDKETQYKVASRLVEHLIPGGFLILGHAESLVNQMPEGIKLIHPTIYQKDM
ncbi:MAG: chemotaxis protein methyltransferase [bacterium]|nr:MAG: chemotaxis protein methyltransferase [bacterium]